MALGEITKQIAQQALLSATSKEPAPAQPQAPAAENPAAVILAQINGMQKVLKDDEELIVSVHQGSECIRVMEMFAPSRHVVVLTGLDANRNLTRVVSAVEALQLICKVTKIAPGTKPVRVGLVPPKPASSNA
jgi:hypothetical protein